MSNFCSDASHLEKKHEIYSLINDMCISQTSKTDYQPEEKIWWENRKRNRSDKIPRARVWTLTTDRNMVRSNALPTELRGTCQHRRLNLKSCFRCPTHCKDQALKHMCYSIGRKESPLQWFAIDPISKKKPSPLRLAVSYKKHLSPFIL